MAITKFRICFVVDMTNVETEEVVTLSNAFVSLHAAYEYVDECKAIDKKNNTSECWTYKVRQFGLIW